VKISPENALNVILWIGMAIHAIKFVLNFVIKQKDKLLVIGKMANAIMDALMIIFTMFNAPIAKVVSFLRKKAVIETVQNIV
jgi:hypothetical protein